ncbi:MAG TPA: S53 family peptidase [Capsulimonadaceae bacterium]|jgi:kumamolisin
MNYGTARLKNAALLLGSLVLGLGSAHAVKAEALQVRLGSTPVALSSSVTLVGRVAQASTIDFSFTLPLRNEADLDQFIAKVSNPKDPLYGHYITPSEFTDRFGPTEEDYNTVKAYAISQGFSIKAEYAGRTILDVTAPASVAESSFGVTLSEYKTAGGRVFRTASAAPAVSSKIAPKLIGVIGLDTAPLAVPHSKVAPGWESIGLLSPRAGAGGTGPGSSFAPKDIATAYNIPFANSNGTGQLIALFELDGYALSDVNAYATFFGLPAPNIENVLIDGATITPKTTTGQNEVTLDLELAIALAPSAKILNYTTLNNTSGILHGYQAIATDNRAKAVSTSWGLGENGINNTFQDSENVIFKQMAAQGQTMFGPAGDAGAFDDYTNFPSTAIVDDPGSQPYVTCVGGTRLVTVSPGGAYKSETTWNSGTSAGGAGGGGISSYWPIPSWQSPVVTSNAEASKTKRNVPDVCLNADTLSPYGIFVNGTWVGFGGTSATTPLWAAFTSIVNQKRALTSSPTVGYLNPSIYSIAMTQRYATDFHDIADNSNNLKFHAVAGYDLATGLGSLNGANMMTDLAGIPFKAGINFFSLPFSYSTSLDTIFGYSGVKLAVWNPTTSAYVLTPTAPANATIPGVGYWVRFPSAVNVSIAGTPASTSSNFNIALKAGWNQIGNPFQVAIPINGLTVTAGGITQSVASGAASVVSLPLYKYNGTTYIGASTSDSLTPFAGYWIFAFTACTLTVPHP